MKQNFYSPFKSTQRIFSIFVVSKLFWHFFIVGTRYHLYHILDVLHPWSTCKYFDRRVGTSLNDSNHVNSQIPLDCIVFEWEPFRRGYLLQSVFTSKRGILRGRSHRLQSKQLKTRENIFLFCLPWLGIEPRTFQSRVFALPSEPSYTTLLALVCSNNSSFRSLCLNLFWSIYILLECF